MNAIEQAAREIGLVFFILAAVGGISIYAVYSAVSWIYGKIKGRK